ncbi:MAG TPA: DNA alkylation repair protein [Verrucomicrobiales bacterium]|jgi:3-methyladenine DNA glycosylase AlkD|nr:DNA alkylation repair protein [Verrucomicrobiales bacterium]
MTAKDIVAELKTLGNAPAKKNWMNNGGAKEPCFGVKVEDMKKIQKRIKMDYQLALDLYDTGIADVMYFAGLIADDAKMTKKDLQKWVEAANSAWVAEYMVPWVASASLHGREMALKWMDSKDEKIAAAGWQTYGSLVAIKDDAELDLAEIKSLLQRAAKAIHQQPDGIKFAMNNFVIAIGCHVKPLHPAAVETANGIGKVAVAPAGKCKSIAFAPERIKQFEARSPIGKKRKSPKC